LLFVLTRASLALREKKPFFTFTSSSFFGGALAFPVSFRQILAELKVCERFGGADVEGTKPEIGIGELEDGTKGPGIELGRRYDSILGCESERDGTGTGSDVEPMTVDIVEPCIEMGATSGTEVSTDVPLPDEDDTDKDEGEGESSGGEGGSEMDCSVCCSSSSLTTSTLLTGLPTLAPTSSSKSKTLSGPAAELSALFLALP
jgi:hypothetical protein